MKKTKEYKLQVEACYHCGESCQAGKVFFDDHSFCCEGCKMVYDLLKENNLCTYYNLNQAPGVSQRSVLISGKYDYLNHTQISRKLIRYSDEKHCHILFYLPKIHCSSCIWLLENLNRIHPGVSSSKVNFLRKEATIVFESQHLQLSELAELLASIGYEPLISQNDLETKQEKQSSRNEVIKIGLAGFCFGNIMMLSFPEYFASGDFQEEQQLSYFFGYLNLVLSLPVFFYSASGFFVSAWKSIRHRYLNIDAPIALAILVTFIRSVYEILSHSGSGYMDSMSGIVFFMLIGRYFQNKTYETLSFERDYKSYFPLGVTVRKNGKEVSQPVSSLEKEDVIVVRNGELIPADSVLLSERTHIDYSFITGESEPVKVLAGQLIYAGGKQVDGAVDLKVVEAASQSYLTQLWNKDVQAEIKAKESDFTDRINRYFTIIVLSIASLSSLFWLFTDPGKALNAFTAVLIVACPCGLLLTMTFANGNILRILGRNKFYLKNAEVIEKLTQVDTILFDKTGTITHGSKVDFVGAELSDYEWKLAVSLAAQSSHPLSRKICSTFDFADLCKVKDFEELPGFGIRGVVNGNYVVLGSEYFVAGSAMKGNATCVFFMVEDEVMGYFNFRNKYRAGLRELITRFLPFYKLKLLSGDNDSEREKVTSIFGNEAELFFNQKPEEKMQVVEILRSQGNAVMMLGDGLNDAGALRHSDVGVAVSDDTNNFSPACDAILDGSAMVKLPDFISLAKAGKRAIAAIFVFSLVYNIIGLTFAVQGNLSPVVAAILMPASSISIVLLATVSTSLLAIRKGL